MVRPLKSNFRRRRRAATSSPQNDEDELVCKGFAKALDPFSVIVTLKPAQTQYAAALNAANVQLGGQGQPGTPGEPIQFIDNHNWLLHIPAGREAARRTVSLLSGILNQGAALQLLST